MKYALLIYQDAEFERFWESADEQQRREVYAEHGAFMKLLQERGAALGGYELGVSSTATTVRGNGAGAIVTDGPFAEVAEQLGGFYFVEARDLDEALELAKQLSGTVEVRPIVEPAGAG
jgi:hypothetical protein